MPEAEQKVNEIGEILIQHFGSEARERMESGSTDLLDLIISAHAEAGPNPPERRASGRVLMAIARDCDRQEAADELDSDASQ